MAEPAGPPLLTERFTEALRYAQQQHERDVRKGTRVPYLAHPLAVCSLTLEGGGDEDGAIAALLHDVAEDHGGEAALADIAERFGQHVADLVAALSDSLVEDTTDKAPWKARKRAYLEELAAEKRTEVLRVSLADKLHNARTIVADQHQIGLDVFARFKPARFDDEGNELANAPDLRRGWSETVWYYQSLAEIYARRQDELGVQVTLLADTVNEMRRLGKACSEPTPPEPPRSFVT
ncbi:MAG: HD domain-containing protein [Acidimicrobiia bacterium]|nr:HD domain-containing protein [Acidimicrobiia bacterium]